MEDAYNRRRQEPDLAQQSSCSLAFRPPTARCIRGREAGEEGRTRRWLLSRNWEQRDRFAHSPASYQCLNCDAGTGNPRTCSIVKCASSLWSPSPRHHRPVQNNVLLSPVTQAPPLPLCRKLYPAAIRSPLIHRPHLPTPSSLPSHPRQALSPSSSAPSRRGLRRHNIKSPSIHRLHKGLPSEDDAECLWLSGANRLEVKCSPTLAGGGAAGGEVARTSLGVHCGNSRFEKLAM
uniref:Uncharacterized protein n=1 Tax=Oryza punctata TaxID=4537 RepID=A0A0E0K4Y1_ORYPU